MLDDFRWWLVSDDADEGLGVIAAWVVPAEMPKKLWINSDTGLGQRARLQRQRVGLRQWPAAMQAAGAPFYQETRALRSPLISSLKSPLLSLFRAACTDLPPGHARWVFDVCHHAHIVTAFAGQDKLGVIWTYVSPLLFIIWTLVLSQWTG